MPALILIVIVAAVASFILSKRRAAQVIDVPAGRAVCPIYVYDGGPVQGREAHVAFRATVLPGVNSMTSVYTGTKWSGACCIAVDGKPIGYLSDSCGQYALLARLAKAHGGANVSVRIEGHDARLGYPQMVALLPGQKWFKDKR